MSEPSSPIGGRNAPEDSSPLPSSDLPSQTQPIANSSSSTTRRNNAHMSSPMQGIVSSPRAFDSPLIRRGTQERDTYSDASSQSQRRPMASVSSPMAFPSSSLGSNIHSQRNIPASSSSMIGSSRAARNRTLDSQNSRASPSSSFYSGSERARNTGRRNDISSSDISAHRRMVDMSDLSSSPRPLHSNALPSNGLGSSSSVISSDDLSGPNEPVRVIWGTNVSIQECVNKFREFLMSFKFKYRKELDSRGETVDFNGDEELFYIDKMKKMIQARTTNLNLDTRNLLAYRNTEKLYHQLLNYPQEVISIMDQTLKDCIVQLCVDEGMSDSILDDIESKFFKVRPYNIDNRRGMRELNPGDIDKLVSVKGLVLRSTPIIPDMKVAFFKCSICNHTTVVEIDRGVIQEPPRCPSPSCSQPNSLVLVHNRCSFSDKQVIKLQETPDLVPDGQTPHSVSLCVYDELVDSCRAGDRVEVSGIFRSIPIRANPKQRSLRALYKTYLDVVHIQKVDNTRLDIDTSTVEQEVLQHEVQADEAGGSGVQELRKLTDSDIRKIEEVSKRFDVYDLLARSIAPSIYELDDVKKGILLQLFGGANKVFKKGGKYRGDINVLLCGDPSTSKSQLLQYVHKIAPRGIYTSGKGSSAVGLTAYITRDVETKQLVLESGALVLSDGGVCCIDEFDKMSDATRSVLHEVMEQQTISVAKAGIITTLNARTSILASANPINSRYDPDLPVTDNIDLPPPLLSRFDLVYLILDKVDENLDRELATHLTNLYLEDRPQNGSSASYDILPVEFLTMYINYAKEHCKPVITELAKDELVRHYVEMRKLGDDSRSEEKRITATTRQLESMIRLSEAHAKMRLSQEVGLEDVHEAVRLIKSALKQYATDPKTGKIDMSMVQTGKSAVQLQLQEEIARNVLSILNSSTEDQIAVNDLIKQIKESGQNVENAAVVEALSRLQQEDKIVIKPVRGTRVVSLNTMSTHL
ncbi:DNA replication licensing factor, mcm4 component [Hanseniaspora vineae]